MNRPSFLKNTKKKICLICEGFEEYDYILRLVNLGVWADVYDFTLVNAESCGNISARYQDRYQSDNYDIVFAFCDTDRRPEEGFELIRTKINRIFGNDIAADKVIIFVNPCTMQVILSHFGDVNLRTQNKKKNNSEIVRLTGLKSDKCYDGCKEHRDFICSKITVENYNEMKKRIAKLSSTYSDNPSTNFDYYLNLFENSNTDWIDEVNRKIES
ncbi:hypothetical protein [Treponema zioleckii]|uniref:hypothetical protein n=1 Tax=Treponema zioleckii TaxID=331680 RepID=UPI00168BF96A|nr:hypothetical protein [Treponema zioleckii]